MAKYTLDVYVSAIMDRYKGIPYSEVLNRYDLTPHQFFKAVFIPAHFFKNGIRKLSDLASDAEEDAKKILEEIESDDAKKVEPFRMEEGYIKKQYDDMLKKSQKKLHPGTLVNPENRIILAYYAIASQNPELKSALESKDRIDILYQLIRLPPSLTIYFEDIKLGGLIMTSGKRRKHSARYILELFDEGYKDATKHASLFDTSSKYHLKFDGHNKMVRTIQVK